MRRIIERTVTIVTTTIWRISWQEDGLPPDPQADPVMDEFPTPDIAQETVQYTRQFPPVIEAKEVDLAEIEKVIDQTADEPPDDPYFYQSKKGNEKP